jgi:hypothetical protein
MIQQDNVGSTFFVFVHENVSGMWVGVNITERKLSSQQNTKKTLHKFSPIQENHVRIQNSQLV